MTSTKLRGWIVTTNIFTGQEVIGGDCQDPQRYYDIVECPYCKEAVSLRTAYLDPYAEGGAKYVHYKCLSDKRKHEIANLAFKPGVV